MGIFKAYDIRGTYPEQIDEELVYNIGRAFVTFLRCKTVVIGRDMRDSSDPLFDALAKGITEMGANVIDIGQCTTPMMYYVVGKYKYDGGIMITASHNPAKYNGLKLVREAAIPIGGDTGIYEMEKMIERGIFGESDEKGKIEHKDPFYDEYVENAISMTDVSALNRFKIIVDSANGMASPVVERFFKKFDCDLTHMYSELDGNFPNHEANPLKPENTEAICKKIVEEGADIGIAFDGDADRVAYIDEKGKLITGDILTALVAKVLLEESPGEKVLYDLRSSWAVKEIIEEFGGKPVMCRVGHSLIKAQMRKERAIFAGELSSHYYMRAAGYIESPFIVTLKVLKLMTEEGKPLSELVAPLKKYFASGEINSKVEDKDAMMKHLEEKYGKDAKNVFWLDGVSVEHDDWWFNVRPSNTEPLLRLNLEATSKDKMEKMRDEVLSIIRG